VENVAASLAVINSANQQENQQCAQTRPCSLKPAYFVPNFLQLSARVPLFFSLGF